MNVNIGGSMNTRVPSVPLITIDPYFSIWSPADHLYDANTVHWTGQTKRIKGAAVIDGNDYRFMGLGKEIVLEQKGLEITATSSVYTFEGAGIRLEVTFLSPLLLNDLDLLSRPVSYICVKVLFTDGKTHKVDVTFTFSDMICKDTNKPVPLVSGSHELDGCTAVWMGRKNQGPLSHSGDDVTIDWGYLYAAIPQGRGQVQAADIYGDHYLYATLNFDESNTESFIAAAYDDIVSVNYFGDFRKGYWARNGKSILTIIEEAIKDCKSVREKCGSFDRELNEKAKAAGGPSYQLICSLAYRHSIAGHKLITDENGEPVFISKECFSNGCAATVDVSYPSTPLYLLFNPELVKGMLRPIFKFAKLPVWKYDFAPHDAGRYPHLTGQVYGMPAHKMKNSEVYPPIYTYPANSDIYSLRFQMPVEECGNMLIMMAAVAKTEGNAEFSRPHKDLAEKWAGYLVEFGANPGEQLCTDDFAGHLASNCNLSAKAIMGLYSYSMLLEMWGESAKAAQYREKAKEYTKEWRQKADRGDHTALVFDKEEGWSLKYNLIWDILFGSNFFDENLYKSEIKWYIGKLNKYGVPLDSRREWTKSDWILWVTAFTKNKSEREALINPIAGFLRDAHERVPFSDYYDTVNTIHYNFQNRTVQGGLFMPLLADKWVK